MNLAIPKHCFAAGYVASGSKYCEGVGNLAGEPGLTYPENGLIKGLTKSKGHCQIVRFATL